MSGGNDKFNLFDTISARDRGRPYGGPVPGATSPAQPTKAADNAAPPDTPPPITPQNELPRKRDSRPYTGGHQQDERNQPGHAANPVDSANSNGNEGDFEYMTDPDGESVFTRVPPEVPDPPSVHHAAGDSATDEKYTRGRRRVRTPSPPEGYRATSFPTRKQSSQGRHNARRERREHTRTGPGVIHTDCDEEDSRHHLPRKQFKTRRKSKSRRSPSPIPDVYVETTYFTGEPESTQATEARNAANESYG